MTKRPPFRISGVTVWGLLEVGTSVGCLATVTGFLGRLWWIFELTCHFHPQLAVSLGAIAVVWATKRRWRMAAMCSAAAAVNSVLVLVLLWPGVKRLATTGPQIQLVAINVHTANERSDLVLNFLRRTDADVILLMEVNERWMKALESLRINYPQVIAEPREDNFGIALFSRLPLRNGKVVELGESEAPSIAATLEVGEQSVFLLGTHPVPPVSAAYARLRNGQFREIAVQVRRGAMPTIVLGDLNSTPWSPYFKELLSESQLKNASQGRGIFGSWPAWIPLMRIPLDHCLVSPSIRINNMRLGPGVGSDHLPLVVDVQIPMPERAIPRP